MKKRNSLTVKPKTFPREPEVLRVIGKESERHGTDRLTEREIEQIIRKAQAKVKL